MASEKFWFPLSDEGLDFAIASLKENLKSEQPDTSGLFDISPVTDKNGIPLDPRERAELWDKLRSEWIPQLPAMPFEQRLSSLVGFLALVHSVQCTSPADFEFANSILNTLAVSD